MAISPKRINRESRGLLDLFRAKVGGQGPDSFDNEIKLTVDDQPFLASNMMSGKNLSSTGTSNDFAWTVPSDEAWLMYQASAQVYDAVANPNTWWTYFSIYLEGLADTGSTRIHVAHGQYDLPIAPTGTVNAGDSCQWSPNGSFLLPPNAVIGLEMAVPAASSLEISLLFAKLKV